MFRNDNALILGNNPRHFPGPFFQYEAAESAEVNIVTVRHRILDDLEKRFDRCRNILLVNSGFARNLLYNFLLRHVIWDYDLRFIEKR